MLLSREIRFALAPPHTASDRESANGWAGWPATNLIVPQLVLRCQLRGAPDEQTGYLCNIKLIDEMLRQIVTEHLIPELAKNSVQTAEQLLRSVYRLAHQQWTARPEIVSIELGLSPWLTYTIDAEDSEMILLTQQFEFSAAHRLHCDELSDEENRTLFGKCNNPEGHGHNYVIDVTVGRHTDSTNPDVIAFDQLEATVKRLVIDRLDHKHLNRDVEYFRDINPSVENIAIAIFNWLENQLGQAKLQKVRVYETPKTWAEYAGN